MSLKIGNTALRGRMVATMMMAMMMKKAAVLSTERRLAAKTCQVASMSTTGVPLTKLVVTASVHHDVILAVLVMLGLEVQSDLVVIIEPAMRLVGDPMLVADMRLIALRARKEYLVAWSAR